MAHPLQPAFKTDGKTITIMREGVTEGTGGGQTKTWTTGNRTGGIPTSLTGIVQPANTRDLEVAQQLSINVSHKVYFTSDPKVDRRDRLQFTDGAGTTRTLQVRGKVNFDEAGLLYRVMGMEMSEDAN